ncbi:hypothetical protein [Actinocorallia sp. A-T 12471]|uniref:hypothetical protein n=1 Tax=Actinocorallia sp. A-T 12471 TaxID=3089813 RepID=UPI0029CE84DB|nr:hypothetical protein [Actinocorallia sp. A-T 12471]MDX6740697.1 hypothetical protein [Actinocorallia sp. A-T 12471]
MRRTKAAGTGLGVLAGLACAACCALPVLIGAGVLTGAGAAVLAERMPLIAVVLAVTAVVAFSVAARRRKAGCGCGKRAACSCA